MNLNEPAEITIKEILFKITEWVKYLLSKWIIIGLFCVIGAVAGLLYAFSKDTLYRANLTFALEDKGASGSSINSIASSFGLNLGGNDGGAFAGDNIIELMKSRFLIENTLLTPVNINGKSTLLIEKYIEFNKLRDKWKKKPELASIKFSTNRKEFSRLQDSVLAEVYFAVNKNNLMVNKIDKKLSIISVKMTSLDEDFSKLFCESLVNNVIDFYIQTKVGKSRINVANLEGRVDSVRRELDNAMLGRASFADRNMGLIRQSAAVPKLKQEMRVQMLGTMYSELVKNLEFSKLALMREEPLIQIIDTPIYPLEKIRLGKLKAMVISTFLFGFLTVLYLILSKSLKDLLK